MCNSQAELPFRAEKPDIDPWEALRAARGQTPVHALTAVQTAVLAACGQMATASQLPALDIFTNNVATPGSQQVTGEGGEAARHKAKGGDYGAKIWRMRRISGDLTGERVSWCGRRIVTGTQVQLLRGDEEGDGLFWSGLMRCGSVWLCPHCAHKITSHRAGEISAVVDGAIGSGAVAGMLTLTIPHHRFQSCKELLGAVRGCWSKLKREREFKKLRKGVDYLGDVRSLEVTHGGNGWHPHLHILSFSWEDSADHEAFCRAIFPIWARIVAREGFGNCSESAFSYEPVRDAEGVADYVSKWGISKEMAEGAMKKKGRAGGRNPFEILAAIEEAQGLPEGLKGSFTGSLPDSLPDSSKAQDIALFCEYARTFKGARQLTWSRGLKAQFLNQDLTDQEITEKEKSGECVLVVDPKIWRAMVRQDLPPVFAAMVDRGTPGDAVLFLQKLGIHCKLFGSGVPILKPPE